MTVRILPLGLAIAIVLTSESNGAIAADQRIEQIVQHWKERAERLKSVRYTLSGEIESRQTVPEKYRKQVSYPTGPQTHSARTVILLDLVKHRYRLENTRVVANRSRDKLITKTFQHAYNLKLDQSLIPRDGEGSDLNHPDLITSKGDLSRSRFEAYLWPIFSAHGIVPTESTPLVIDPWPHSHEAEEFELRGTTVFAGRSCTIIRGDPSPSTPSLRDEFFVDVGRQSAILRHTYYTGKNPYIRLDTVFRETPYGWLPHEYSVTWSEDVSTVVKVERMKVEKLEIDVAVEDGDFTLNLRPGMIVDESEIPGRGRGVNPDRPAVAVYVVGSDGELELQGKKRGFTTHDGVELPPESNRRRIWWVRGAGILVAFCCFATACVWYRRRQLRPQTRSPIPGGR